MMSKIFKRFQSSRVDYTNKELFDRFTQTQNRRFDRFVENITELIIREHDMQNTALKFILTLTLTGMGALYVHTEQRFDQVDKRFEQVDKRFEQVDKRFEQVDKRFEHLESELKEIKSLIIAFSKK